MHMKLGKNGSRGLETFATATKSYVNIISTWNFANRKNVPESPAVSLATKAECPCFLDMGRKIVYFFGCYEFKYPFR